MSLSPALLADDYLVTESSDALSDNLPLPKGIAVDLGSEVAYSAQLGRPFMGFLGGYSYGSDHFEGAASFLFLNDGQAEPSEEWMSKIGNLYYKLNEVYTRFKTETMDFTAGYLRSHGTVDTPYDVVINGNHIGSLGMDFNYRNGGFSYETRWISVNLNSAWTYGSDYGPIGLGEDGHAGQQWLDRGVNYRQFSYDWGKLRLGYEESAIYLRTFDPLYFTAPVPCIFINSIYQASAANPWAENTNDNSMMGLFGEYKTDDLYLEAQFLIDDLNIPYFIKYNEDKFAWSLGGYWDTSYGRFSFYHAGATEFTYESTYGGNDTANLYPTQYTYYPLTSNSGSENLDITDNSIGFMYGENSLAFRLGYQNKIMSSFRGGLDLDVSVEYVLNGTKSPDNPWAKYEADYDIPFRIGLFNEDTTIEQRIFARIGLGKTEGDWRFTAAMKVGEVFNPLVVTTVISGEPAMYVPESGNQIFVFDFSLSARYMFKL
jgi:hypothetical protein